MSPMLKFLWKKRKSPLFREKPIFSTLTALPLVIIISVLSCCQIAIGSHFCWSFWNFIPHYLVYVAHTSIKMFALLQLTIVVNHVKLTPQCISIFWKWKVDDLASEKMTENFVFNSTRSINEVNQVKKVIYNGKS